MFQNRLSVTTATTGKWVLLQDLIWVSGTSVIRVPKGFATDLASIPRPFRLFITVNGKHRESAVLHDWLYNKKGKLPFETYSRAEADRLFLSAMKSQGVNWLTRSAMYAGVRLGGWVYWRRK